MIRVPRELFALRAEAAGVPLADAMACVVEESGGMLTVDASHPAYPRARPGLGDMVAAGLDAVGITKARVEAIVGGPCGCDQRREILNDVGRRFGIG